MMVIKRNKSSLIQFSTLPLIGIFHVIHLISLRMHLMDEAFHPVHFNLFWLILSVFKHYISSSRTLKMTPNTFSVHKHYCHDQVHSVIVDEYVVSLRVKSKTYELTSRIEEVYCKEPKKSIVRLIHISDVISQNTDISCFYDIVRLLHSMVCLSHNHLSLLTPQRLTSSLPRVKLASYFLAPAPKMTLHELFCF